MELESEVGEGRFGVADGTNNPIRAGRANETIVADGRGRYAELAARGQVFSGMTAVTGTTIVAANVSPVGAAGQSVLSLFNPSGSGMDLELIRVFLLHISGTPGAGAWVYNILNGANVTATQNNGGSAGVVPFCQRVSGKKGVGQIFTQTALTGAGAQTLLRTMGAVQFAAAIAATTQGLQLVVEEAGSIVLPPNTLLSIAPPAAGTTHIVAAGFEWAEVPST